MLAIVSAASDSLPGFFQPVLMLQHEHFPVIKEIFPKHDLNDHL